MTRDSTEIHELKDDCLHLLMALAALKSSAQWMAEAFGREDTTRNELHLRNIGLREQENALVVRLCRFDDDRRQQVGLRSALKSVRREIPAEELRKVDKALAEFRALLNPLKVRARNELIAHLREGVVQPHDSSLVALKVDGERRDVDRLQECAHKVIVITDQIIGDRQRYNLKSGSMESPLDLRDLTGIDRTT